MRSGVITAAAIAAVAGLGTPVSAGETYGVYSGGGFNAVVGGPPRRTTASLVAAVLAWNGSSTNPATIGTAANPMPVYGRVMLFQLRTGAYRVVPID